MFISNAEKAQISSSLKLLQAQIQDLKAELASMKKLMVAPANPPRRKSREWTPEQRKAASDRMKIRQAEKIAKRDGL
jgi:hypothetical protein